MVGGDASGSSVAATCNDRTAPIANEIAGIDALQDAEDVHLDPRQRRGFPADEHVAPRLAVGLRDLRVEQRPQTRARIALLEIGQLFGCLEDRRRKRRGHDDARLGGFWRRMPERRTPKGRRRMLDAFDDQQQYKAGMLLVEHHFHVTDAKLVGPEAEHLRRIGIDTQVAPKAGAVPPLGLAGDRQTGFERQNHLT